MSDLYYFNPLSFVHHSFRKDVLKWSKVYGLIGHAVGMNDRMKLFKQPVAQSIYSKCELPTLRTTTMTYADCCDTRAKELFDLSESVGKPLGVMWSGGIDSTMIMVSFLRNYPMSVLKDKIKIITSAEAANENPNFYKDYILPNFELVNAEHTPWLFDGSMILVSGEFNDQLFGSDLMKMYIANKGAESLSNIYSKVAVFNYIDSKIKDQAVTTLLVDAVEASARKYGISIEKNSDFFWWYNFCFKWQSVYFRMYALIAPRYYSNLSTEWNDTYMHHFYHSDDFQIWSINHPEVRIIPDWKNYKQAAKDDIFKFDKDYEYYKNKIKRASLYTVFGQRKLLDGIDSDFKPVEVVNPNMWYNPDNPFRN